MSFAKIRPAASAFSLLAPFCVAIDAQAGGFLLDHQNATALGMAFAGAEARRARVDFGAYNPAAFGGIETTQLAGSITGMFPRARYSNAAGVLFGVAPVAGDTSGDGVIPNAVAPNISFGAPVGNGISIGLVANASYGLSTEYGDASVIRYQARRSEFTALELTPVAAAEIAPGVFVGAGLRVVYADLGLGSTIDAGGLAAANSVTGFAPGSSDLAVELDATGWDIGYRVGLQAELAPSLTVGASYNSKVDHDFEGDARFGLAASPAAQILNGAIGLFAADGFSTSATTPASAAVGAALAVAPSTSLNASFRVQFWSSFDVVTLDFNDGVTPSETITQAWNDSIAASVGVEHAVNDRFALRGGVMFDQSPAEESFVHPRIPDSDRLWFAAGLSAGLSEALSADLGFAYAAFDDQSVALGGTGENVVRGALFADFETDIFAASLTLRARF